MTYKILRHKTKEGVYAVSEWDSMGGFELRESDTPYLYPAKFTKEFYKPVHDLSDYDLVEVEIKEVDKKPSYKIQTVSYGETTISVDHLPAGSKVIIENNEATIITSWTPVTESLPGIGNIVEIKKGETISKAELHFHKNIFMQWRCPDCITVIDIKDSWREIQEGE